MFQDKYMNSFKPWWNRTRVEQYETAVRKTAYMNKLIKELNITDFMEQVYLKE